MKNNVASGKAGSTATPVKSDGIPAHELPTSRPQGALEPVAFFDDAMPTGVTVSHTGRIFVNFPKWGDDVKFTVAEIRDGQTIAYPNQEINETDEQDQASTLVSVQSVVVDPADRLWILDTGSPLFKPTEFGGPKLICINLDTNQVIKKFSFLKQLHFQLPISMIFVLISEEETKDLRLSQILLRKVQMD